MNPGHVYQVNTVYKKKKKKQQLDFIIMFMLYVTVPGKRDHLGNFFKIELLLQQERVGFELQNALHI